MNEVVPQGTSLEKAMETMKPSRLSRFLDAALEPFAPGLVAKRLSRQQELGYRRAMLAYSAGQYPWETYQRGLASEAIVSEEAMLPGYSRFQMIIEARDLFRNFAIIRAGVNGVARRAIATGIHPHFHSSSSRWNREAEDQWEEWCCDCELRGLMDLDGISRQAIRSCFVDGDLGVILVDGPEGDLRLQLIEADLISDSFRMGINLDTMNPIGGVILERTTGTPVGYMVGKRGMGGLMTEAEIIPTSAMLLLYRQQRVDQVRGVPLLAPVMQIARDLDRYITATRMQANIAATYGVVVKRENAAQFAMAQSQYPGTVDGSGGVTSNSTTSYRTMPLKTGLMTFLHPGEDIQTFDPGNIPGPRFDEFSRFLVRMIAVGMGTTYEMLMQDYSNMSFSSSRTNLLDANLTLQEWHRWIITKLHKRVYPVWVAKRMASGRLRFNPEAYGSVSWQTPAELGVDPQRDAAANIALLNAGLDTYSNLLQEQGMDWKETLTQKADEAAFIKELAAERGIAPELITSSLPPGTVSPSQGVAEGVANQQKKSVTEVANAPKP